jgi:hypothetical protein
MAFCYCAFSLRPIERWHKRWRIVLNDWKVSGARHHRKPTVLRAILYVKCLVMNFSEARCFCMRPTMKEFRSVRGPWRKQWNFSLIEKHQMR